MKHFLLVLSLCLMAYAGANAQCSACVTDSMALMPASNYPDGAFYPNPFPEITQGQPYDTSITYVMPKTYDTGIIGVVNIEKVRIVSISGLPSGITWSTNVQNNTFYPQTNQYDCIKICGTTFAAPGVYPVTITVEGFARVGSSLVSQPVTFSVDATVVAGSAGTSTFTATNFQGCDSITTSFEALIDASPNPTSYAWDFGNGNTSTDMIPQDQNYTTGTYPVILQTTIGAYFLDTIFIGSVNENWEDEIAGLGPAYECNDITPILNTPTCPNQKPDLFIQIIDGSDGSVLYTSASVTDKNPPLTYTGMHIDLSSGGPFLVKIIDDDSGANPTPDDEIGTYALNTIAEGTFSYGGGLTTGTYGINVVPTLTYEDTLDIVVSASPAPPTITKPGGSSEFCNGDSIMLVSSVGTTYQWFKDSLTITGATDSFIYASEGGVYSVEITNGAGCTARSAYDTISLLSSPPGPVLTYQSSTDQLIATNGANYTRQWYFNGAPIPGATGVFLDAPQPGAYTVEFTNNDGCKTTSAPFSYTSVGDNWLIDQQMHSTLYPNPNAGAFNVDVEGLPANTNVNLVLTNILGQQVLNTSLNAVNGALNVPLHMSELPEGMYMLQVTAGETTQVHKMVIKK